MQAQFNDYSSKYFCFYRLSVRKAAPQAAVTRSSRKWRLFQIRFFLRFGVEGNKRGLYAVHVFDILGLNGVRTGGIGP